MTHQAGNFAEGSKDACLCSTQICCQLLNKSDIQTDIYAVIFRP